jgi:predicted MPP superfamily phosphohydrolase
VSSFPQPIDPRAAHAGRPSLARRELLARMGILAGAVPVIGAVDGLMITPRRLTATDHAVGNDEARDAPRLSVLQLSDLHLKQIGDLEERLLEQVHARTPDVIVLTGDIVDRRGSLWQLELFLRRLPHAGRRFAIPGNWEHWAGISLESLERLYAGHGVELLVNRSAVFDHGGHRVRVTGLDDLVAGKPDADAALSAAEPCANHLLLAHCPAARDHLRLPRAHAPTFMLSGHTHGGQIAPFGLAIKLPHGSGGYVSGWYRDDGVPLYVSRGIGTSLVPVRIGATPELAHFDWSLA